jgi:hypothetical protein
MEPSRLDPLKRWLSPVSVLEAPTEARQKAAKAAALGREHLLAARIACDQRLPVVAVELYTGALLRFDEARRAGRADAAAEAASPSDASTLVAASPHASGEAGTDAAALLGEPAKADGLDAGRARKALALLDRVAADLESATYPVSDDEVARVALRRRVVAGILAVAALSLVVRAIVMPRNVARGKPVTASSIRFGTPQGLVNGAIEWGTFGLHTGGSGHEWATIDLLGFYTLDSAEIYSRGDGRFDFNIPLRVELSDDGSSFRAGGACSELFTQSIPCVVDLHHQRARYVRVTAPEVVLAEVEVYGK